MKASRSPIEEAAAELFSAAASNGRYHWWCAEHTHGAHSRAATLAQRVVDRMNQRRRYTRLFISEFYAEAEAILRTGGKP
jgi:hypothetical protein